MAADDNSNKNDTELVQSWALPWLTLDSKSGNMRSVVMWMKK